MKYHDAPFPASLNVPFHTYDLVCDGCSRTWRGQDVDAMRLLVSAGVADPNALCSASGIARTPLQVRERRPSTDLSPREVTCRNERRGCGS